MTIPQEGHEYQPDWIPCTALVMDISKKGAVKVMFTEGAIRWFRPSYFREHFTHCEDCLACTDWSEKE